MSGPLKGTTIIEFSGIGPGPFCGMVLADLGAEVIKIDRASSLGKGNELDFQSRSKYSITADLKKPDAIDEIKKLLSQADALFEGFRPGVMERLGLGPEEVLDINPNIVYGRILNDKERSLKTLPKVNKKPITSELGNVTPIIVHPGNWSRSEIKHQAKKIVTAKLNDSGFNCIAAQVIVLPKDWKHTQRLKDEIIFYLKKNFINYQIVIIIIFIWTSNYEGHQFLFFNF